MVTQRRPTDINYGFGEAHGMGTELKEHGGEGSASGYYADSPYHDSAGVATGYGSDDSTGEGYHWRDESIDGEEIGLGKANGGGSETSNTISFSFGNSEGK